MSLRLWLDRGDLQKIVVTEVSLSDLQKLIDRDIKDSGVEALSADRKFATAYGAALNLANYVLRKQGYRVSAKTGHHRVTFEAAAFLLGTEAEKYTDYFDLCRRKRNKVDYDLTDVVTTSEVEELSIMVRKFMEFIYSRS